MDLSKIQISPEGTVVPEENITFWFISFSIVEGSSILEYGNLTLSVNGPMFSHHGLKFIISQRNLPKGDIHINFFHKLTQQEYKEYTGE